MDYSTALHKKQLPAPCEYRLIIQNFREKVDKTASPHYNPLLFKMYGLPLLL